MPVIEPGVRTALEPHEPTARPAAAALSMLVLAGASTLPTPLYALYRQRYGLSALAVTALFAVYCLALLPSLACFGPMSDRRGPRRAALIGLVLSVCGTALFAAATSPVWLFAGRVVQGVAVGAWTSPLSVCVVSASRGRGGAQRSRLAAAALCAGAGVGPVLSGIVASWGPMPLRLSFLIQLALTALVGLLLLATFRRPTPPRLQWVDTAPGPRPAAPSPRWRSSSDRDLWRAGTVSALVWAVAAVVLSILPQTASMVLNAGSVAAAGVTSGALLLAAAAAQLTPMPSSRATPMGLSAVLLGMVLLVLGLHRPNLGVLVLATACTGAGLGWAFASSLLRLDSAGDPTARGRAAAAFYVLTYLGEGVPVLGVGLLADRLGLLRAVTGFLVGAIALTGCLVAVSCRWRDPSRAQPTCHSPGRRF